MDKKCDKYESLFTFRTEDELTEHLKECDECRQMHEKMEKVSALIQEVKPYYRSKQRRWAKFKAACALFIIMASATTLGLINFNADISDTLKYGTTLSAEDYGFPVDSYGLIYVE